MFCAINNYRTLLCALLLVLSPTVSADSLDVRLLVDVSQPMHDRDTSGLRRIALKSLISQLPEDSQGSVWGYGKFTQRFVKHEHTSAMWKQVAGIHVDNLSPASKWQNPLNALTKTVWDLTSPDRQRVHLVWISSGQITLESESEIAESRQEILEKLGNQLSTGRVVVHTMAIGPETESDDLRILNQLSEMTGGLHRVVADPSQAEAFANALVRLFQTHTEALVDGRGRFQVAPGTERFTVMWPADAEPMPGLRLPDGSELNRLTSLPLGRWLIDQNFEMATIEKPATGWWTLTGPPPVKVGLFGDINVKVGGLRSPVVPSEETSALVELYHWGSQIVSQEFLDLLEVRAWLVQGGERQGLPIEREGAGFRAFFLNLDDGAYEFEVSVIGPTFRNKKVLPFQVKNPLRVEVRSDANGKPTAWLSFSHAEVNYATVRASAKVRKPPQLSVIVPGQSLPSGLWQIALPPSEGIVEVAFSLGGNYLNGEGFFLKTQPITVTLPMVPGTQEDFRFDAAGKKISAAELEAQVKHEAAFEVTPAAAAQQAEPEKADPEVAQAPTVPLLPWWFVAMISFVSLIAVGLIWWFFRPAPLELEELDELSGEEAAAAS